MTDVVPGLASVIVPAYNHEAYVEQTLQSIVDQTYPHVEIVVVNDGSQDGTGRAIDAFKARCKRPMRVIHQANAGLVKAIATGLMASRGQYVSFLASDDWIFPDKIEFQVRDLEATGSDAVFGNVIKVAFDGSRKPYGPTRIFLDDWDPERFVERLVTAHGPFIQSGLFRRSTIDAIGGVDHGIPQEDWPILILVARQARRVRVHPRAFTYYRHHPTNTIRTRARELKDWKLQIIDRYVTGKTRRDATGAAYYHLANALVGSAPFACLAYLARSLTYQEARRRAPGLLARWWNVNVHRRVAKLWRRGGPPAP